MLLEIDLDDGSAARDFFWLGPSIVIGPGKLDHRASSLAPLTLTLTSLDFFDDVGVEHAVTPTLILTAVASASTAHCLNG